MKRKTHYNVKIEMNMIIKYSKNTYVRLYFILIILDLYLTVVFLKVMVFVLEEISHKLIFS